MRPRTTALLLLFVAMGLSLAYGQSPLPSNSPGPITAAPIIPEKIPGSVPPLATVPQPLAPVLQPPPALLPRLTVPPVPVPPPPSGIVQTSASVPALGQPTTEPSPLPPLQQQMHLSALRGTDWLASMNNNLGLFLHGWVPALNTRLEGDHYLHQAGAAFALARGGRFAGKEDYTARAAQSILTLLDQTEKDPADPQVLYTSLPSIVINRLGAAALIVLAIHELPAPQQQQGDLLDRSEQLCNFIRKQARPDGSLSCGDPQPDGKPGIEEADAILTYPGQALYALMRSQRYRPATWKIELVRKALAFYAPWWRQHKSLAFVSWQSAAYTEAYLLTKERAFADFVFEMNDWLCGLQYERLDPGQQLWLGGFMSWQDGKAVQTTPRIDSAECSESLGQACRAARAAADQARHKRYTEALERSLQFLTTLQYSEANTQHFEDTYRKRLVGGFHASHQDGNLRIDHAQHALSALVLYLDEMGK